MKSNWISSSGVSNGARLFVSAFGILGLLFLPDILQVMHDSHFFRIASVILGHQKCRAAIVILLMAGWPLCNRLMMVFQGFFVTMFLSSIKTKPDRLDSFSCAADTRPSLVCAVDVLSEPMSSAGLDRWWSRSSVPAGLLKNSFQFPGQSAEIPVVVLLYCNFWGMSDFDVLDDLYPDVTCPIYCGNFQNGPVLVCLRVDFAFFQWHWGRIVQDPLGLITVQAYPIVEPVLVCPFPRRDLPSIVPTVLFGVGDLRCIGDQFIVVYRLHPGLG